MNTVTPATLPVEPAREPAWLELSLAQRAVWLDASLAESPSAYTLVRWARINGDLQPELCRQAMTLVVARHDALRLRADRDAPRQWLHQSAEAPFTFIDVSAEPDPESARRAHVEGALAAGLPLGDRPLFAFDLIKLGAREFYAFMRCHHLLADEAAVSMLLGHWLEAYRALTSDGAPELAPPSSYVAVIDADAAYVESARYQADLDYWTGRFKTLSPALFDVRRGTQPDPAAGPVSVRWTLDGDAFARFISATRAAGVTPQRAVIALLAVVLGRRYRQADITLGMALHRRDPSNLHVIGMLAGMIAVRGRFDGIASLRDTVRATSKQIDADLRHARLPIDALSRALGISRTGLSDLFSVAVSYLPALRAPAQAPLDDLTFVAGALPAPEASPLTMHVSERDDGRALAFDLSADSRFADAAEIDRLRILFEAAAAAFAERPDTDVEAIAAVTPAEFAHVVHARNTTAASYPSETADRCFTRQARSTPDAPAVTSATESLTYAQIDGRSDHLARLLAGRGVRAQSVVGVALERSVATVVSLLAILKLGAIYLPLDPAYPGDRLAHMIEDAHAEIIIVNAATQSLVPAGSASIAFDSAGLAAPDDAVTQVGPAGAEAGAPAGMAAHLPTDDAALHSAAFGTSIAPEDTAYIIYTSGSTGKPKGVAVPHRAAVNLAFARLDHDPIGPGDRILAAISVGFDVSIGQLLLPLLSGAAVVIADDLRTLGAQEFWAFLAAQSVTHINSVPSFFESILDAAPPSTTLVRLMLGGEPLSATLVRRLQRALPHTQVVNMYGPTEACIDATCYPCRNDETAPVLPIGKPLPNYRAYVLDDLLEPVGIGVAGDLYLAGAGLAHGYVNAPALTAERFVPDPFGAPGERLYKTGDRARRRDDGNIEFLGRADSQVKIRGHRIELGEIEAALRTHAGVAQAAVIASADGTGPARLVAYLVAQTANGAPSPAALRAHLAGKLPEYMLPAAFITLDALPLTANGKLDERALPAVDWQSAREYVAPRTASEINVAKLFAELLNATSIGATDNFFERGGHSLLATRLVSQLRTLYDVRVPLRAIFDVPTVEGIARIVDAAGSAPPAALAPLPRPEQLPLSFTQERLWFLGRLQADDAYNVPVAVELTGNLDASKAIAALEQIVARHEALRTVIVVRDGVPGQQIRPAGSFAVRIADLTPLSAGERQTALAARLRALASRTFDLAVDLPIEVELIALAADRHVLAAVVHHASFDGWSAALFFAEFAHRYAAADEADALPPLPLAYADFAVWQRAQDFSTDLNYWRGKLAAAPPTLDFPADRPRSELTRRPGASVPFGLDEALTGALTGIANANGASLFMLLHAAFAAMLARWTGQHDIVVGTAVANRTHPAFEPIIGCFVNTLALRTAVEPSLTFAQLLAAMREDDLAAYEHGGVPFEQLVSMRCSPNGCSTKRRCFKRCWCSTTSRRRKSNLRDLTIAPSRSHRAPLNSISPSTSCSRPAAAR